ncbi:succinate dehydrogenase, cytochrome b556 subunit [Labrenzia sp. PHM005]|uniref:succinate dehydrogenase, cytochrome b556 subunit n=1 Tax=Labrenzia sp. PHM005 TaxID=2590016 RepID=UPI0011408F6C|nr:succinate dehydrogenase, cytochrome b556 subunit [Labrenzia sp. PHM005]QDG74719.1 succinate dehydrogenase, cytochrome b556 subunit [Labrenzia sp. PHM005]
MSNADLRGNRPLSPHLQIYKPILTMVMSILHRITGAALYFGTILLAWWLIAAAAGPAYFDFVNELYGSILGRLILFGFTWALVHHMLGGIRHFIWDMGAGFGKEAREWLAKATIVGSVSLTLILWIIGYAVR